ncbi:MAG: GNAT family N-acetyltransferase [Chloroflexi bacterium]|nr:GNAT family N-acetyltransferase [Chloroflexota bacterium]
MNLLFRPARPEDATQAVPLIYSSGPAAFEYVFTDMVRGNAAAFLHSAFSQKRGEFGYANHTVVEVDGQVVGIGATFSGRDSFRFGVAAARQILAFYGLVRCWRVIRHGLQVEKVVQLPTPGMHYLAHLGVAPAWRGQGIGARLIDYFLQQGQEMGRSAAALDVAVTNPRAQALYERLGFIVTQELPSSLKNEHTTVAAHRRMEKQIIP